MSDSHHPQHADQPDRERLLDLLADQAVQPLTDAEREELNQLMQQFDDIDPAMFELSAAGLSMAFDDTTGHEPLPAELAAKVARDASDYFSDNGNGAPAGERPAASSTVDATPTVRPASGGFSIREAIAWVAAAAALLFAVGVFDKAPAPPPTVQQQLSQLKESATDLINLPWQALEDPSAKGAAGSIVWSTDQQQGFMTFTGLEQNDPAKTQYQLWIFDKNQTDPIDGGVFDVTGDSVTVPIDSKLKTVDVYQFAVTIEQPGGVVKSKQERVALLAALDSA